MVTNRLKVRKTLAVIQRKQGEAREVIQRAAMVENGLVLYGKEGGTK